MSPDEQIVLALRRIMSRWRESSGRAPITEVQAALPDIEATIVMSGAPRPATGQAIGEAPETVVLTQPQYDVAKPASEEEDFSTETVFIGAECSVERVPGRDDDNAVETVILGIPEKKVEDAVRTSPSSKEEDLMAETVVMGSGAVTAPGPREEEASMEATVVLGQAERGPEPQPEKKVSKDDPGQDHTKTVRQVDDLAAETIILGAEESPASLRALDSEPAAETVILGAAGREGPQAGHREPPDRHKDEMEATVIMGDAGQRPGPPQKGTQETREEDAVEETVIMGAPAAPRPQQAKPIARGDDDLDETIIITPDKKGRQP